MELDLPWKHKGIFPIAAADRIKSSCPCHLDLSRLSAKFRPLSQDIFIHIDLNRVEEDGNIKTYCGFGELLE